MRRRAAVTAWAALLAGACGGSPSPSAATTPGTASSGDPAMVAQLDAVSFDTLVVGAARPSLVEFHSPT